MQLDAPLAVFEQLAADADALEARVAAVAGAKPVPRFALPMDPGHPDGVLPYSPVTGRLNPIAPPVDASVQDGRLIAQVILGPPYEGAVGFAHGGVIAMIWDQVLALANVIRGTGGPTGELSVRYRAPSPLGRPLRFEAWHESHDGRRIRSQGHCHVGDVLVSEAEGTFVELDRRAIDQTAWGPHVQLAGTVPTRRNPGDPQP